MFFIIILQHNEKVESDSLDMITDNTRENDQATITTPTNAPIVQNMPLTNPVVIQQEQVHIQTQVQEYEQKDAMSTRVIEKILSEYISQGFQMQIR